MKLPKIRSLTLNTSYKFLNKNNSEQKAGGLGLAPFQNSPSTNTSQAMPNTYGARMERLKREDRRSSLNQVKEVTGENFHTNYGKFGTQRNLQSQFASQLGGAVNKRNEVEKYVIDDQAKCICFCEQRLGSRTEKCTHGFSEDVDVISKIIADQSRDFLMADKHTGADLNFIKDGLNKVEFIRTKNYLSKLAVLISRQEKEIFNLNKKTRELDIYKDENESLKSDINELNQKLSRTVNLEMAAHVEDKNFLSSLMLEKDKEIQSFMEKLRQEASKNKQLILQVQSQEVEVRTLLNCVENLRKQAIEE